MTLAQGVLVWLLVRQMGGSGVGSASKVAYATVGAQTAMDAYFFVSSARGGGHGAEVGC